MDSWFARHAFPVVVAASIFVLLVSSTVPPNLWVVKGPTAAVLMVVYALGLLVSARLPLNERLHRVGAVMAVFTWGGRGGGFVSLSIERGTWELAGAVAERVVIATALVMWHSAMASSAAYQREMCAHASP